jgi:hypothetical protein
MRHGSCRYRVRSLILALLASSPTLAEQAPASEGGDPKVSEAPAKLGARAGYAFFGRGRSLALEHRLKPALRLDALWPLATNWELGAAARGVITSSTNYGVWALTGALRYAVLSSQSFALRALLGIGVGYNAPILHSDLEAGFPVIPYATLALQPTFVLAEQLELGIELESEQLSVIHLGAVVNYALD